MAGATNAAQAMTALGVNLNSVERWQRFEHLVARIHQTLSGDHFAVEHDVVVTEPGGAEHQVDVRLIPRRAFMAPILISCKSSGHPVAIDHVREWSDVVQHTGASAGVIVSPTGFTEDAIDAARAPARRLSLWRPRALTVDDFGPDERSPNGYIASVEWKLHLQVPQPRQEAFALEVESVSGRVEGRSIEFVFSAATRNRYSLRDEHDNVVGNLWDDYIEAAEQLQGSGTVRLVYSPQRFMVFDGYRVRFKMLRMQIDMLEFVMPFETNMLSQAFAYENVISGAVEIVPLPASLLGSS